MSQARIGPGGPQKVQCPGSNTDAETKRVLLSYLSSGGVVLQIIPSVGDPVRMAPCGGVVLRPGQGGLVECDADALFLAPDDVARPFQLFRRHEQREAVGDEQWGHDLKCGPGVGQVANRAVDSAAAELDRSGLQRAPPRRDPGLVHDVIIC